jgi:carbamoyltransferase
MNILGMYGGVTLGQHDPSAALISDGKLIAVCEEERFMRVKSPRGCLPVRSIRACLREANLKMSEIDLVVNPGETFHDMPERIRLYLNHYFGAAPPVRMINHQLAHIASAFFCSGYEESMCMSYDAWGDQSSAALGIGALPGGIELLETREPKNSLGIFYATMTSYLGFLVSEDEYKVMGLAAYGHEEIDLKPFLQTTADGYHVNMDYVRGDFSQCSMFEPLYGEKLVQLLGPARQPGEPLTSRHKNIAFATQKALEECAVALITHLHEKTGLDSLCIAGGVGLNCSANRVLRETPFIRRLFVQPASSDRGLSLGCALQGAHENGVTVHDKLEHVSLGPTYSEEQIRRALELSGVAYVELAEPAQKAASMLAEGNIIGWFQGRSEFGPRALGNRSILADPREARMKDEINARIKFREEFRPFAPSVLEEHASELFEMDEPSPFMTMAFMVRPQWRDRLQAVTHVNGTARVQTVNRSTLPLYHELISQFHRLTGVPVVLNTSFNVQGQPIVETPLDALSTFTASGMDALFIGPFMVVKPHKPRR